MKKVNIFLSCFVALFLLTGVTQAQVFMVVKGETSTPYNNLDAAVTAAEAGSTVYIPSGAFTISSSPNISGQARANTLLIDKPLTLIGAGVDINTLHATVLTGNITLTTGASGTVLEGFALQGSGLGAVILDNVSHFFLKRCRIGSAYFSGKGDEVIFRESQIGGFQGNSSFYGGGGFNADASIITEILVQNCILTGGSNNLRKAIFSNNVFTYDFVQMFTYMHECIFFSNIFYVSGNLQVDYGSCSYNSYTYNLVVGGFTTPGTTQYNTVANNITNQYRNDIFGTTDPASTRYKLPAGSPGKGTAVDGTDMGIYGGSIPAKELRLPPVPQVMEFSVAGTSNPDGTLKVTIKVEAQDE